MSNLGPQQQNGSFGNLLQIPGGVTPQLQQVQDGEGNATGLWLSSAGVNVTTSDSFVASVDGASVTGAIPRLISDGFGDYLSVLDFGALGDGVTDDSPAFQAAINSVPSGSGITLHIPKTTAPSNYILSTPVTSNGRIVNTIADSGATVTGTLYIDRKEIYNGNIKTTYTQGAADSQYICGEHEVFINTGTTAAYGSLRQYTSNVATPTNVNGGDVGFSERTLFNSLSNAGGFGFWHITVTPNTGGSGQPWGVVSGEYNIVSRIADTGWHGQRGQTNWSGMLQLVPDVGGAWGSDGGNTLFGIFMGNGVVENNAGVIPRMYNGIMLNDAIAPNGRALYFEGSSSASIADWPYSPFQIANKWDTGIQTLGATFQDFVAVRLGVEQSIQWGDTSNNRYGQIAAASNQINFGNTTGTCFAVNTTVSNPVNFAYFAAGSTSGPAILGAAGEATATLAIMGGGGGVQLGATSGKIGFFESTPVVKPTVTGSKGANAALTSLLSALSSMGLIVDSTT